MAYYNLRSSGDKTNKARANRGTRNIERNNTEAKFRETPQGSESAKTILKRKEMRARERITRLV